MCLDKKVRTLNEGTPEEVVCNENLMGCFTTGNKTVPKAQIAEIKVHTAHNMPAALLLWLNILFPLIIMMMLPSPSPIPTSSPKHMILGQEGTFFKILGIRHGKRYRLSSKACKSKPLTFVKPNCSLF